MQWSVVQGGYHFTYLLEWTCDLTNKSGRVIGLEMSGKATLIGSNSCHLVTHRRQMHVYVTHYQTVPSTDVRVHVKWIDQKHTEET